MRFGFIGSRPLHLVPFSSLPLHTLLFPLFFHVLLSSCLVTSSFSSFARIGPGLSVYVHFYLPLNSKHRFQVAQVFIMRWASSVVPVHLVPLSFQPHTHNCPVSSSCHVFILLSLVRAHVRIGPHLSFTPPLGEACVCVPLVVTGIPLNCFVLSRGTIHVLCAMVQRSGHSTCGYHG